MSAPVPMVRDGAGRLIRDPFYDPNAPPEPEPEPVPVVEHPRSGGSNRPQAGAGRRTTAGAGPRFRVAPTARPVRRTVRPRSAAALQQRGPPEQLNTSVAVRNRGTGRGRRTLTAMAVGPQAPPGSPPRPRQVIIPAGAVDENDTTVLDVPAASPLEQPQRVLIPAGTVHADETMVVVVPAPRALMAPGGGSPGYEALAAAAAAAEAQALAAERERQENEERVANAKQAYLEYLSSRNDKEAYRLKRMLHGLPPDPFPFDERAARKAEAELWEQEMPEVDLPDIEPADLQQPYRLQMSMNIEEFPPSAAAPNTFQGSFSSPSTPSFSSPPNQTLFSPGYVPGFSPGFNPNSPPGPPTPPSPPSFHGYRRTPGHSFEEAMAQYGGGELSDIEPPDSFYGEDAGWEPVPPQPLLPEPEEDDIIPPISPPRYLYQGRHAPHDPGDLMWEWEEPPRPAYELPIMPEPEPYSAELFRLVRL